LAAVHVVQPARYYFGIKTDSILGYAFMVSACLLPITWPLHYYPLDIGRTTYLHFEHCIAYKPLALGMLGTALRQNLDYEPFTIML